MVQERSEQQALLGDHVHLARRPSVLPASDRSFDGQRQGMSETLQTNSAAPSYQNLDEPADRSLSAPEIGAVLTIVALLGSFAVTQFARQFSRWVFWKTLRDRLDYAKPQKLPQIPCTNCRFFNQNPYLKCTVHPDRALTPDALHCSDYWSNQSDRFNR
ncbi:MAG: hypothetical protein VKK04_04155 [Synechococcales bacterium]|nr:hypothetical protein [Synechococcales bacterium]